LGPVFRAYDAERERLVAVKLFKIDLPPHRVHQLVAAFEQLIAADLTHPAIAVPLATGITGVSAYLAQDYVAAESLDLAVREYGPAPPADALRVAAQLAGALDFGAVVRIDHGGLHPRDVLLSADETRLTGIGVTRALETIGVAAPVRRPYTAPERMAGNDWNRRADQFSLAALVHELLWGRRISGTGSHAAEALTELPGSRLAMLQDVFARALAEDPADRFDTALEFAEALKAAFPDIAISEPETPAKRRAAPAVAAAAPRLPLDEEPIDTAETVDMAETVENVEMAAILQRAKPDVDPLAETAGDAEFDLGAVDLKAEEQPIDVAVRSPLPEQPHIAAPAPVERVDPIEPIESAPPVVVRQSSTAVWPLAASLALGLAIGFAAGYGMGGATPAQPAQLRDVSTAAADESATATAGRDATEVAVPDAPKPAPVAEAPAARVPPAAPTPRPVPQRAAPSPATRQASRPAAARVAPSRTAPARPPESTNRAVQRASVPPPPPASRFTGSLNIETKPAGARVFLDGRLAGVTPLVIDTVSAGNHTVRIERDGYRRWTSSVRVVATEQNRITASLER
jgi:serine/threonine-protein kinase